MTVRPGRRRGFTLVEVLIVVLVVGILAAIVIPRVWPTTRQARESGLRGNLHHMRTAIMLFQADCGDWPGRLEDVLAKTGTGLVGGRGQPIPPDSYHGPYFISLPDGQLPLDPFTGARDWVYDPQAGTVHSRSDQAATDGTPYSSW